MIDLKNHNQDAFNNIIESIQNGKKLIAVSRATGSGKSYLSAKVAEYFNDEKKLFIVPTKYLRDKMAVFFNENNIKNTDFMVYQKISRMSEKNIEDLEYSLVILDEFHHNTSPKWGQRISHLMKTHKNTVFFGTSATTIRTDGINVVDKIFGGNCVSTLSLSDAIVKRVLPLPKYVGCFYNLDEEFERLRKKIKNATNSKEEKNTFYNRIEEMRKNIELSYGMPTILHNYLQNKSGKYLVFCKDKNHLKSIKETVIDWFKTSGIECVNSYTVFSNYELKDVEYKKFCEDDTNSAKLLFCVNMLNEGLHLDGIAGVLLLRPTRSNIIYFQQIGRAMEANNTKTPIIIDAVNNFNSIGNGFNLLEEIKSSVELEKKNKRDFDVSQFDFDNFFITENVINVMEMFKDIENGLICDEWLQEEKDILINRYENEGSKCFSDIPNRTHGSCTRMARKLGLQRKNDFNKNIRRDAYTNFEDELIKKHYMSNRKYLYSTLERSETSIRHRANVLGLYTRGITWNENERNLLLCNLDLTIDELSKLLPGRTKDAIIRMRGKLNIKKINPWKKWEDKILFDFYPEEGKDVYKRLVKYDRSGISCRQRANKLGIKRKKQKISHVSFKKDKRKYKVYFYIDGKQKHFGYYDTFEEAEEVASKVENEIDKVV